MCCPGRGNFREHGYGRSTLKLEVALTWRFHEPTAVAGILKRRLLHTLMADARSLGCARRAFDPNKSRARATHGLESDGHSSGRAAPCDLR
jgi:hypothetical protein